MAIYAILAVEFFATFGQDGVYYTYYTVEWMEDGVRMSREYNKTVDAITARGLTYGEEYYGTFTRAFYTMWQILTGESWSEAIVRPLMFGWRDGGALSATLIAIFFCSFLVICAIVLINVVVAVLLEKMVGPPEEPEKEDESEADDLIDPLAESAGNITRVHPIDAPAAAAMKDGGDLSVTARLVEVELKLERLLAVEKKVDRVLALLEQRDGGLLMSSGS